MAKLFLDANETFKVSNNVNIIGSTGTERVLISGTPSVQFDQNIEGIDLAGNVADYTFLLTGNTATIISGTTTVATIPLDETSPLLRFANGSSQLVMNGLNSATLGGTPLPTGTAAAVVPATINAADISQTAGSGTPQFNASVASSVIEGGTATFNVTLSSAQAASTSVTYAITGTGGAVLGTDTGTATPANTGTLTFAAGEMVKTITVPITFDSIKETGEGLLLTLSGASTGTALGTTPTAATAIANPATPTFTITSDAVAGTPTQEGKNITFTITPSSIVDADTTLLVNMTGSVVGAISAQASAADFTSAQTVTFKAGETAARTTFITVVDDSTTEGIEGYKAQLLNSSSAEVANTTGLINDPSYTYVLTGPTSVDEGASATFTVTADRVAPTGGITIPYTITGNATAGTDFTPAATTGTITIAAGSKTGTVILNATADNTTEATAENVIVTLGTPSTGNVTTGTVTTTINDTSQGLAAGTIALTTSATAVDEGGTVTYTVTLGTAAPTGGLNVPYTFSGTATTGTDYTGSAAATGNITVAAGATTGTLTVTTVADNLTEGAETVINTITAPTGYTMVSGKNTTTTTINDTSIAVTGQSFTLTTALDSITGTAGDDTILGDFTATSTFNPGDQINAGAGSDTLKLYGAYAAGSIPISITGVEIFNFVNPGANPIITTSGYSGVTKVQVDQTSGTGTAAFTTGAGTTLQLASLAGAVQTGVTTWTAAATDTIQNLILNGFQGVAGGTPAALTITGASTTTLNITSQGTTPAGSTAGNQISTLTAPATTSKVNITGATGLGITTSLVGAAISEIDASATTGGVNINVVGTAAAVKFTGGSGNDRVTFSGAQTFTTADNVVGGSGTDTLEMLRAQAANTATAFTNITGFETLNVTDATTASDVFNLDHFGVTNIAFTAIPTATTYVQNIISGATLSMGTVAGTVNLTIKNNGSADALTINASGAAGTYTVDSSQFENLTFNTSAITGNTVFAMTDPQMKSVTLVNTTALGTNPDFTVNLGTLGVVTDTVNVSAFKAATATNGVTFALSGVAVNGATVTGSANNDVIGGSSQADTITPGGGADSLTAGAGNDTIDLTETTAAIDTVVFSTAATNGVDTVKAFAVGTGIDIAQLQIADTTVGTLTTVNAVLGASAVALVTGGAAYTTTSSTATSDVIEITTTLDSTVTLSASSTGADILQALSSDTTAASGITANGASNMAFFIVYQNNNAYMFHGSDASADSLITAAEIRLVGVFENIALGAFVTGDIVMI